MAVGVGEAGASLVFVQPKLKIVNYFVRDHLLVLSKAKNINR